MALTVKSTQLLNSVLASASAVESDDSDSDDEANN